MKILSTATRVAGWMALFGLVCGVLYSVGGFFYDLLTTGLNWGTAMAFGALVGMPLVFWVIGFSIGALVAIVTEGIGALLQGIRRRER